MFGWEFPPYQVGGLGVVSRELAHALTEDGVAVTFVLPRYQPVDSHIRFIFADVPYDSWSATTGVYMHSGKGIEVSRHTFTDFIEQLYEYARQARGIAQFLDFDVIHAHDWLTFPAGLAAREVTGKPLIVHVHNTIFDRGLGSASDTERSIEYEGIHQADGVIVVSNYTKDILVKKYGVAPDKIEVVHNAIGSVILAEHVRTLEDMKKQGTSIVLYHGRVTLQKGVEYFVRAAATVLAYKPNVLFIISGSGDRVREQIIEEVAHQNLSEHFLFVENVWGRDRDRLYRSADVLVMPSVSEPFGIVPLEALAQETPVIVSKQSGVAEVLKGALKVDFWDTDEMANKILAVLEHKVLQEELTRRGKEDIILLSWKGVSKKCREYYQRIVGNLHVA